MRDCIVVTLNSYAALKTEGDSRWFRSTSLNFGKTSGEIFRLRSELYQPRRVAIPAVRVLIELLKSQYELLRQRCDPASRDFRLLVNGCSETRGQEQVFQIICAESDAVGPASRYSRDYGSTGLWGGTLRLKT